MNLKIRKLLRYIGYPLLFLAVGSLLFLLFSGSLVRYVDGNVRKMIYESKPVAPEGLSQQEFGWKESETAEQPEAADKTETIPEQGEQYAEIRSEDGGWSAPLYYGDSPEILQKGAGQYANGIVPGMDGVMLVSGHDSTFFAPLEDVREGEKLSVKTEGGTFTYTVTKRTVEEEADIAVDQILGQEGEHLVLYTCYPFGSLLEKRTQRYFVYCDRDEER